MGPLSPLFPPFHAPYLTLFVSHSYSGGAHASAWAVEYLQTYGSGLNVWPSHRSECGEKRADGGWFMQVVAAAYGGTPVDATSTLYLLNDKCVTFPVPRPKP